MKEHGPGLKGQSPGAVTERTPGRSLFLNEKAGRDEKKEEISKPMRSRVTGEALACGASVGRRRRPTGGGC